MAKLADDQAASPELGRARRGLTLFSAQHLVKLKPIAVELVDRTMLELAAEIAMFRPTLKAFVHGEPEAILLVEFDEGEVENQRRLKELAATMGDLGFGFDKYGAKWGGVVEVLDPALQAAIAALICAAVAPGLSVAQIVVRSGMPPGTPA